MTTRVSRCGIAVVLGLSGCRSPSVAARSEPVTGVAFHASSLESHYTIRGSFTGVATRERGRLVILVHEGTIRSTTAVRNLRLRAGLGRRSSQGWEYEPHGPAISLRDTIGRGQTIHLDTLRLTIPISDNIILAPHWIAFEIAARRGQEEFSTFVCTQRDIFRPERSSEASPRGEAYVFWC